jgi:hypothetical protein
VSDNPDVSNIVTENLSATTNVPVPLNPVCIADNNCSSSVAEPSVKQFSETGSQTDFQENAPLIINSLCKDKRLGDVKPSFTPGVTGGTHCDLILPPTLIKHHSDISELYINGGGMVINQAMSNRIGDSVWVMCSDF